MPSTTLVLAMPLDHAAEDLIEAAASLAPRLDAAILPVHAHTVGDDGLAHVIANGGVRETIVGWLEPLTKKGITVLEPILGRERPERLVALAVARSGAQLVVSGSGRSETVRDWLLGRTADRILRGSAVPVWLARGALPGPTLPVLVPVDLLEQSRLAIAAGLRWARLFGAPLRILHVLSAIDARDPTGAMSIAEREEARVRAAIAALVGTLEVEGVSVQIDVLHGPVVATIESAARESGMVVLVHPDWDELVPASMGSRVARLVHGVPTSVLAIRDDDTPRQRELREDRARWVTALLTEAETALDAGDPARAERLLETAKIVAPVTARVEDLFARTADALGRAGQAERHRALAAWLRASIG